MNSTTSQAAMAVASLETHRLIITVPNEGPADIASNLAHADVARLLRHLADQLDPATRQTH